LNTVENKIRFDKCFQDDERNSHLQAVMQIRSSLDQLQLKLEKQGKREGLELMV
jgi:hypothetical protein